MSTPLPSGRSPPPLRRGPLLQCLDLLDRDAPLLANLVRRELPAGDHPTHRPLADPEVLGDLGDGQVRPRHGLHHTPGHSLRDRVRDPQCGRSTPPKFSVLGYFTRTMSLVM